MRPLSQPKHRRSRTSWATRLAWMLSIAFLAVTIAVAVGKLRRRDELSQWRRGLEVRAGNPAWPEWSADWPPLPPAATGLHAADDFRGPYAFVARQPDLVRQIPCYCGCVSRRHRSISDCFVTGFRADGRPIWTPHAYECSMCLRIVREVMLMKAIGLPVRDIRAAIDAAYAKAGKPTETSPAEGL